MGRRPKPMADVSLQVAWSLSDLGQMVGKSYGWVHDLLEVDATSNRGVVRLPGDVDVPAFKHPGSTAWTVYRHQFDLALARATQQAEAS